MVARAWAGVISLLGLGLWGCADDAASRDPRIEAQAGGGAVGDPERGKELIARFECNRCHDGTGLYAVADDKHCFHCHDKIERGLFDAPPEEILRWQRVVAPLCTSPSLEASRRFRRGWLTGFLQNPHDLRPQLVPTMPRLAISEDEALDIATYLAGPWDAGEDTRVLAGADAARGRAWMEAKGCFSCHSFTGVSLPEGFGNERAFSPRERLEPSMLLAPDLRFARERLGPARLVAWLLDPKSQKADAAMPRVAMSEEEASDIALYILSVKLEPRPLAEPPQRLPLLTRPVHFEEVDARVFHQTCWHCHSEPDYARGDGGPGNTGGFGFAPRGLDLSDYSSIHAGYLDNQGERHSVFEALEDGTPRLVAALLARQAEEAGRSIPGIRGMPLGLPALSSEEIQLVASWVAQGRPR